MPRDDDGPVTVNGLIRFYARGDERKEHALRARVVDKRTLRDSAERSGLSKSGVHRIEQDFRAAAARMLKWNPDGT